MSERVDLEERDRARLVEIAERLESAGGRDRGFYLRYGSQAWRLARAGLLEAMSLASDPEPRAGRFRPTARGWAEADRIRERARRASRVPS